MSEAAPTIVIVANRGPKDFVWRNDRWVTRPAAGGLVSMLTPLARRPDVAWFCCVSEPPDATQARQGLFTTAADQSQSRLRVVAVPLPAELYQAYYGRISNEVLWMLQHQVVGAGGYEYLDHTRHLAWDEGYLAANQRLAEAMAPTCATAKAVLIQDYHLYPLPALLRQACPNTRLLHFTHIPFPEPSRLRLLPSSWRNTILRGLLGADVLGFQTQRDVQSFLACCADFLGVAVNYGRRTVRDERGRLVRVASYAASVDVPALKRTMRTTPVIEARKRLAEHRTNLTVIRVDRLDPSKNQVVGFLAFERLLEMRPDLRPRVKFLAFLVPSRTDLGIYRAYRDEVYRHIERINARFEVDCGGPPVVVFYTNDREQALAAMRDADVSLVNSLQDGMNLVAKEWAVVSQRPGVLVVSETAGVAEDAADSALLVSPLDVEGTAQALARALDMPTAERTNRLNRFLGRVQRWTAADWLAAQLTDLGLEDPLADRAGKV